jgi:hypothetical protein
MATLTTGKMAEVLLESAVDTYEHQMQMLPLVTRFEPNAGDLQNSGNAVWRPVQQHAPIIDGWDLSSSKTGIIEETYPAILGTPKNDFVELRADDMRDKTFWERRGEQSGKRQATELNKGLAELITTSGSLFYRTSATSGYDAIAEAGAMLDERQKTADQSRYAVINDRDYLAYGSDLAARQTVQGRPETVWATGQIGQNVAGFEGVYKGSFLPNLTGGAAPTVAVTADVSEAPEAGSVNNATGQVTNVDYRVATIAVDDSSGLSVGDKIKFTNGSDDVQAIGLADKNPTGQPMTFTIVEVPNGTSIKVYPKPIALDDSSLSTLEQAYANIDTQILDTASVTRLNTDASKKANIFWTKDSIEVMTGEIPAELMKEFGGMKVISATMSNGQIMYLVYDGNIENMTFQWRLFTWYGLTNADPSANGVFTTFSA